MDSIVIPLGRPASFDELKRLNPDASPEELAEAFPDLPDVLKEQAWESLRLRVALTDWNTVAESERDGARPEGGESTGSGTPD